MKNIFSIIIISFFVISCSQRIEFDFDQWGNNSDLTNVQIFKHEVDDNPSLYETTQGIGEVSGLRRIIISNNATIDLDAKTAEITLIGEETLDEAGFLFFHNAKSIEPLQNSPTAGLVSDLNSRNFTYRAHSANGEYTDWTIIIN